VAPRRIVVVGASLAGLRAAETLRRRGFDGELTIVGAERHAPYDRPPLSKQLLAGTVEQSACALRRSPDLDATWRLGTAATALDPARGRLRLADGAELRFDGLVLATGCAPRRWPGELPAGVHVLRGLDDALALRTDALGARRVAVLGAGFIGCEVAATLRRAGVAVALIDVLPHPLAPLGPVLGGLCARIHAEEGVELHLSRRVAAFEGAPRLTAIRLDDGTRVEADVALLALGAVADVRWLAGSGLRLEDGVVTDAWCFADARRRIVCAGDVAVFPHPLAGERPVAIRHWSNAVEQAAAAAGNLLAPEDERRRYEPVPSFWSDQYDVRIQSVGLPERAQTLELVEGSLETRRLVALGHRAGRLVGAIAFNSAAGIAAPRRQLAEQLQRTTAAADAHVASA
jgi:3-phenylpropionate/trans-cinnamate dioxygenase ferredoxin reductase subunit